MTARRTFSSASDVRIALASDDIFVVSNALQELLYLTNLGQDEGLFREVSDITDREDLIGIVTGRVLPEALASTIIRYNLMEA
jgi:hypothetical protein